MLFQGDIHIVVADLLSDVGVNKIVSYISDNLNNKLDIMVNLKLFLYNIKYFIVILFINWKKKYNLEFKKWKVNIDLILCNLHATIYMCFEL